MKYSLYKEGSGSLIESGTINEIMAKLPAGCRMSGGRAVDKDGNFLEEPQQYFLIGETRYIVTKLKA